MDDPVRLHLEEGEMYIDQRARVVEVKRWEPTMSETPMARCTRCVYCTPIGQDNVCRRKEIPPEALGRCSAFPYTYFVEVKSDT